MRAAELTREREGYAPWFEPFTFGLVCRLAVVCRWRCRAAELALLPNRSWSGVLFLAGPYFMSNLGCLGSNG
jgi:hypothetical protein